MEAPRSMEVEATHPILARVLDAVAKLDTSSKLAIVCIAFGWFFFDTLVVSAGSLILIMLCGALPYSGTSREFFAATGDAGSLGGSVIRFANNLVRQGSGLVSKHVSIGAGGYLGLIGSLVLSAQGLRRFNRE